MNLKFNYTEDLNVFDTLFYSGVKETRISKLARRLSQRRDRGSMRLDEGVACKFCFVHVCLSYCFTIYTMFIYYLNSFSISALVYSNHKNLELNSFLYENQFASQLITVFYQGFTLPVSLMNVMISKQPTLVCFSSLTEDPFFFFIRNQGKSHSLEDLASPGSLHGGSKSPRLQRTMSVNQRSSPRSRFSVQENRFSFNNRGKSLKELSFRECKLHAIK